MSTTSSETVSPTPLPADNPLLGLHQATDAEFQSYGGVEIVSTFGEPQAEYSALHKGAALMDLPQRGILRVSGKDRLDFLNRFLTNELMNRETKTPLPAGEGVYAYLLNNKGRIVCDMNVLQRADHALIETDARNIPTLTTTLEKFVFSEQVQFATQVGQLHQIAVHGPKAAEILKQLSPDAVLPAKPMQSTEIALAGKTILCYRDDPTGSASYYLIISAADAPALWNELTSRFAPGAVSLLQTAKRELWPTGWAAFNATRIEAGRPLFGIDFDDTVLPAETSQLDRAVSFTKGCYLGQEIVARMHARGQVSRLIVGIRMDSDALPIAGSPICNTPPNQVGGVTSSTISPILSNVAICLALVKRQAAALGTKLQLAAEGSFKSGTVVEVPFVKPETPQ